MKKILVYFFWLISGFSCGAGSMIFYSAKWPGGYPGIDEIGMLDFENSLGLVYYFKSDHTSLIAHRASAEDPFYLQVISKGKEKHCLSTSDLGGFLDQMSSLKSTQLIEQKDLKTRFPIFLGRIQSLDEITSISNDPVLFYSSKDGDRIAAQWRGVSGEVENFQGLFKALEAGCAKLGMH